MNSPASAMESSSVGVARRYACGQAGSSARLGAVLDERLISNLHVHALRRSEAHADRDPGVLFQASTIAALLDGAYEGDLTFAELAEHGDLGLGTVNALDGEMIALDGRFYRADVDGFVHPIAPTERTPFAVVVPFEAAVDVETADLDHQLAAAGPTCAWRFDGEFDFVRARSVPRQHPPYRPLAEVAAEQHVFEMRDVSGTIVGFRFPDYASGVEVVGDHLHFISDDCRRGGHVLEYSARPGRLRIDPLSDLHVELPAGVELGAGHVDEEQLARIERAG
jgi:acetolactate decarboxylase